MERPNGGAMVELLVRIAHLGRQRSSRFARFRPGAACDIVAGSATRRAACVRLGSQHPDETFCFRQPKGDMP